MKPVVTSISAVFVASLVLGACEKSDNVAQLHDEAVATAKYYTPRVDELDKRRQAIFQRGRNVPGNLPDVSEIVRLIGEAGDKVNEMKGITGSLAKQADDAAKANKPDELEKLIDESSEKLDADETVANDDLTHVEAWLWQYEQTRAGTAQPPVAPPAQMPNETTEAPPAAAGQGSAANADEKKPAEKAAEKAATEKADKGAAKAGEKAPAPKAGEKAPAAKAGEKAPAPKAGEKGPAPKAAPKAPAAKAAGSAAGSAAKP